MDGNKDEINVESAGAICILDILGTKGVWKENPSQFLRKVSRVYNDLFVADANTGSIYHFDLNEKRSGLQLRGPLKDKIIDDFLN